MKKLLCTIGLILISGCGTHSDETAELIVANRERIFEEAARQNSAEQKAERLKQIIANRERIFAEANKRKQKQLIIVGSDGSGNYYSELPEWKRQEIYRYAVTLDDKSGGTLDWEEGNKMVAKKYGISVTEARNIALEGAMKLWPQPEPPDSD